MYQRISADRRHTDVILRLDEKTDEPCFSTQWMALKPDSEIDPQLFLDLDYAPGLPVERFESDQVKEFLLSCFPSRKQAAVLS